MPESSLITTPFHSESTASEVVAGINLAGRRAVVTGATSGIGLETARTASVTSAPASAISMRESSQPKILL